MSETITIKIDVNKIDKSKLFAGKKGTYLDVVLIPTPNNQYGNDYMAVQGISKEEREAGIKGEVLGNANLNKKKQGGAPKPAAVSAESDVPF